MELSRLLRPPVVWVRTAASRAVLVAEATAVIEGRCAERIAEGGAPVPAWAWLNALAHRPPEATRTLAAGRLDSGWSAGALEIATELSRVAPAELAELQTTVLVEAELHSLGGEPDDPTAVVRAVRRHLASARRSRGAHPRGARLEPGS